MSHIVFLFVLIHEWIQKVKSKNFNRSFFFFTKILEEYKQNWKGRDEQDKLQWNETSLIMASEKNCLSF